MKRYLITCGAGFIGNNFVLRRSHLGRARIINLDLLTYAGNLMNLESLKEGPEYDLYIGTVPVLVYAYSANALSAF